MFTTNKYRQSNCVYNLISTYLPTRERGKPRSYRTYAEGYIVFPVHKYTTMYIHRRCIIYNINIIIQHIRNCIILLYFSVT